MAPFDLNQLFSSAEQCFIAGRFEEAKQQLSNVIRAVPNNPPVLHLSALVERRLGNFEASKLHFRSALMASPNDAKINSNFANLLGALGQTAEALDHYDRALVLAPEFHDARHNRALLLQQICRLDDALQDIDLLERARPSSGAIQSTRASILRDLGRLRDAALAYDKALAAEPQRASALHGRARVALELGEEAAVCFYRRALTVDPANPELLLGLAQALEVVDLQQAITALAPPVLKNPQWVEGQAELARMKWEAGEGRSFTDMLQQSIAEAPTNSRLWATYASTLAGADFFAEAADAVASARRHGADDASLALFEAVYASEAGQTERAAKVFVALPDGLPGRSIHEARHRLRIGDYDGASFALERARHDEPQSVQAWALTGLAWRLTGDERAEWLNSQPGLWNTAELGFDPSELREIADCLIGLHRSRAFPLGQSLRGGTQTRGRLFERSEPKIVRLRQRIEEAVSSFWARLPARDENHPLLRYRDSQPRLGGSWSVKLDCGGFHVAHCHPKGILSSAVYFIVPEASGNEGWLEIGGPPHELSLPLKALDLIEPKPGRLALFPSYLFHGTLPFSQGQRLTCAFDVVV